jgi:hypothetical protein
MSQKEDYTTSEWTLLIRTLLETAGVMMAASPGGIVGETVATYQALNEIAALHQEVALIKSLVASMASLSEEERHALQSQEQGIRGYDEIKRSYLTLLRQARFVLAEKATPDESTAFKKSVLYMAERVANASKEGGFLGIGGTRYTENEQELVKEIESVLGIE